MEDITRPIGMAAAVLCAYLGVRWISADAKRPALLRPGEVVLRANRGHLAFALMVAFGGPALLVGVLLSVPLSTAAEVAVYVVMCCVVIVSGATLLWRSVGRQYRFDARGITMLKWGRVSVSLAWDEMNRVRFRSLPPAVVLEGPRGEVVRVSLLLGGIEDFLAELERREAFTISSEAIANARQFRDNF